MSSVLTDARAPSDPVVPPRRQAVLDLGSNSFHVLIADVHADGTVVPVGREREMLHLGAVVQRHGHVPPADVERAVATVAHLTELAKRLGATERLAVATSALRDAANGAEVVAAMEEASGVTVDVIDGDAEARYGYLGVRASVATDADPLLVLDLGGGSLEFALGWGLFVSSTHSVDLGVSRLSAMVDSDPLTTSDLRTLRRHVRDTLAPVAEDLLDRGFEQVVAVGGTIRALARVVAAEHHTWLPATLNQLDVGTDQVTELADRLLGMDADARSDVDGMKSRRADRIHIAALVLAEALDALDVAGFTLSDWGLREGVLLANHDGSPLTDRVAMRRREATRLRETFVPDDPHLAHVAELAVRVFDATHEVHGLDDEARHLLWCGANLHDVGETLALRRHHRHGAYIVEHAELRGFSPRDTAILCSMVRFHTSRGCSKSFPAFAALSSEGRELTERLVAILQLADGLDRARDQAVTDVTAAVDGDHVVLTPHGRGLHVAREELARKTAMFERVLGVTVEIA